MIAVFLMAAFLRFHDLAATPPGLSFDEAMNGVNAMEALKSGSFEVFYPDNNGREGLFINIQALFLGAISANQTNFHVEPWMLRFPSAVFGTLTVIGLFFLTRLLTQSGFAGGSAALFAATSFWHINFSRIGLRAISSPCWLVWALFLLLWGFAELKGRPGRRAYLIVTLAGVFYGLGFHTYIAYRVSPIIVLAVLAWLWREFARVGRIRQWAAGVSLFLGTTLIVVAPLILYFVRNPQAFTGRAAQVSVLSSPSPGRDLLTNIWKTLAMFNFAGDPFARHNVPGRPELFLPVGLLFVVGIAVGIWYLIRREAASWPFVLCFLWAAAAAAPAVLSNEGQPHSLRSILMIPPCMILAALGADRVRLWLAGRYSTTVVWGAAAVLAVVLCAEAFATYFETFAKDPRTRVAFEADLTDLGRELAEAPPHTPKYIVMVGTPLDARGNPALFYSLTLLAGAYGAEERESRNIHFVVTREEAERVVKEPGALAWVVQ